MPHSGPRPCTQPGCPNIQRASRCQAHALDENRHRRRTTPTKVTRDWTEQQRRKASVDAHRAINGEWCPGYGRPAHRLTARDGGLTADHVDDIAKGGSPTGPLQALCRSCNSRKAHAASP